MNADIEELEKLKNKKIWIREFTKEYSKTNKYNYIYEVVEENRVKVLYKEIDSPMKIGSIIDFTIYFNNELWHLRDRPLEDWEIVKYKLLGKM